MPRSSVNKEKKKYEHLLDRNHSLNGGIVFGIDGYVVEIQARAIDVLSSPSPVTDVTKISGMAGGAIREAKDRILGAFSRLRIPPSPVGILINLAPASLEKAGTWLDLPLAIIMLQAAGHLPDLPDHKEGDYILLGELGLHGEVRRVPGALSVAHIAKPGQSLIVPTGNEKESALILAKPGHENCGVYPVSTLEEVLDFFKGKRRLDNALKQPVKFEPAVEKCVDFSKIRGQKKAKDAALISAAGGHNMLLVGPPGEGKSMLASALPGILPRLRDHEKVELTRIYSACGALEQDGFAVTRRPMRSIHHSASIASLVGGGSGLARPGEITLAHLGVLFLDELAEFSRSTLDTLRQPIESGEVSISRVNGTVKYPCYFTLVAAMNPCPCGYFGSDRCTCSDGAISAYQGKISGPLLDRIDLQVDIQALSVDERFSKEEGRNSAQLRAIVQRARDKQAERYEGENIPFNAAMPGGHVLDYCNFSDEGFTHYKSVIGQQTLSTRSVDRLAKVARTIADLADEDSVRPSHVDKAATFVVGGMLRKGF